MPGVGFLKSLRRRLVQRPLRTSSAVAFATLGAVLLVARLSGMLSHAAADWAVSVAALALVAAAVARLTSRSS